MATSSLTDSIAIASPTIWRMVSLELVLVAGQHASVDAGHGLARDDVVLVAGVEHRRVGGVLQSGPDEQAERAEVLDRDLRGGGTAGDHLLAPSTPVATTAP